MKLTLAAGLLGLVGVGVVPRCASAAMPQCATHNNVQTCFIDRHFDRTALCNDGTVPAFSYRPGFGSGAARWIIWLQGGSECDDPTECFLRASSSAGAALITSNGFVGGAGAGLVASSQTENPSLYNANTVFVHYCSSDTWAGNRAASAGPFSTTSAAATWNFKGRSIALAAVQSVEELAPAISAATQVIIGGDSAGGEGIAVDANDILPLLPAGAPVLFVEDAGFALAIGQFDHGSPAPYVYAGHPNDFQSETADRLAFWNGRGDAVCDAAATSSAQHSNCYNSSYVIKNGFIKLPSFVAESQLDTAQLTLELCPNLYGRCAAPSDAGSAEGIYAVAFEAQMAANVTGAGTRAAYWSFSPDEYAHVILDDNATFTKQYQFPSGGVSPREAFDAWLANPTGPRTTMIGNAPGVP